MAKSYADITKQIENLQKQAEELKRKELAEVIANIKEAIAVYGLTAADLGLAAKRGPKPGTAKKAGRKKATAKYSDGTGNVWSGRGPRPIWLRDALKAGKALEEFLA